MKILRSFCFDDRNSEKWLKNCGNVEAADEIRSNDFSRVYNVQDRATTPASLIPRSNYPLRDRSRDESHAIFTLPTDQTSFLLLFIPINIATRSST